MSSRKIHERFAEIIPMPYLLKKKTLHSNLNTQLHEFSYYYMAIITVLWMVNVWMLVVKQPYFFTMEKKKHFFSQWLLNTHAFVPHRNPGQSTEINASVHPLYSGTQLPEGMFIVWVHPSCHCSLKNKNKNKNLFFVPQIFWVPTMCWGLHWWIVQLC